FGVGVGPRVGPDERPVEDGLGGKSNEHPGRKSAARTPPARSLPPGRRATPIGGGRTVVTGESECQGRPGGACFRIVARRRRTDNGPIGAEPTPPKHARARRINPAGDGKRAFSDSRGSLSWIRRLFPPAARV